LVVQIAVHAPGYLRKRITGDAESVLVSLESGATIQTLLTKLGIPVNDVWRIAINGTLVSNTHQLQDNDRVLIFPPMGGG